MKNILQLVSVSFVLVSLWMGYSLYNSPPEDIVKVPHITYEDFNKETKIQIDCLAENIYYEARGESDDGKKAVAFTTLNRTHNKDFPETICKVVKQRTDKVCQFSWVCDSSIDRTNKDIPLYKHCKDVAVFVYVNSDLFIKDSTEGSLYYHADYVNPHWKGLERTAKIGQHIFYRPI